MKLPNFFSNRKDNLVMAIEASKYTAIEFTLPSYEGMHTIKNITPKTSDDLFYFHPGQNIIPGYVEAANATTLNLIDGKNKLVVSIVNSFYHAVIDSMSELLCALEEYPDSNIVIDISEIKKGLYEPGAAWDIFNDFVEGLREDGFQVNLVSLKEYEVIYMDNFRVVQFIYESGRKANLVYEFFKRKVTDPDVKPYRDVFVSRALASPQDVIAEGLSYKNDHRMDDSEALEQYFADLGYEIIHSERFPSFKEQMNYFYSARTIAGVTGSGLANAVFMQPGGTVFEIITPLIVPVPPPGEAKDITNPYFVQEIHNFYKNLSFYQNHTFLGVQNPDRSFEKFKEVIESDPKLKNFLDRND